MMSSVYLRETIEIIMLASKSAQKMLPISFNLTLQKIAILMSKNCQKLSFLYKKIAIANFLGKNDNLKKKNQVFDIQMVIFRRISCQSYETNAPMPSIIPY